MIKKMSKNLGTIVLDPYKRLLIRNQLVLILHSQWCQQTSCPIGNCSTMKTVIQHAHNCTNVNSCPVHHCVSTRQIGSHWHHCQRNDTTCEVCSPFKERITSQRQSLKNQSVSMDINGSKAAPEVPQQHWHSWITPDVRNRMVEKLVLSFLSSTSGAMNGLDEAIVKHIHSHVKGIELEMFESARSLVQYHHLIWRKVYIIESYGQRLRELTAEAVGDVIKGFDCLMLESALESDNDFKTLVLN